MMNKVAASTLFLLIMAAFLTSPAFCGAEEIRLQVVVQKANLRASPDLNSTVVIQVSAGTALTSDRQEGEWYRIVLPPDEEGITRIGYIHRSVVEVLSASGETIEKKQETRPETLKQDAAISEREAVQTTADVSVQTAPHVPKSGGPEFGLRIYGGYDLFIGENTLNDASQGITDYFRDLVAFYNLVSSGYMTMDGSLEPLKSGPTAGGELFFNINPYLGFGLGAGVITGFEENTLDFAEALTGLSQTEIYSQKISAPYVQMTVYGGLPLGNMIRIAPYLGGGLYLGTITLEYHSTLLNPSTFLQSSGDMSWIAKKTAFGLHGGLNIEFNLSQNVGLFFGAGGILANFTEIAGDLEWSSWHSWFGSDSGFEKDQKLWAGERDYGLMGLGQYPAFFLNDQNPSDPFVRNVKPGVISISQFRFVIGVNIFFLR